MNRNPHIGESFDSFLRDEGIYDEVTATAIKRTLALQIEHEMEVQHISKSEMAIRFKFCSVPQREINQVGIRSARRRGGTRH
jgi:hypothetical protein